MELINIKDLSGHIFGLIIIAVVLSYYSPNMKFVDLILLTITMLLILIITMNITNQLYQKISKKQLSNELCSSYCSMKETMDNVKNDQVEHMTDTNEHMLSLRRSSSFESKNSRENDGVLKHEDKYNVITYNTVPQIINEGSFESGYSYLPPKDWFPIPPFPPVCVTDQKCSACPVYTDGTNIDLKEWDSSRRIMPPDEINVDYIKDKLNSGR